MTNRTNRRYDHAAVWAFWIVLSYVAIIAFGSVLLAPWVITNV